MNSSLEQWLVRLAVLLTALLLLLLAWGGGRVLLLSGPEPIIPAESTLRVDGVKRPSVGSDTSRESILERPLFWQGRATYTPPVVVRETEKPAPPQEEDGLDEVKLLGTYGVGRDAGIIISHENERYRLRRDESVAGWVLTEPVRDGAYFEKDGQVRKILLQHALPGSNKDKPGAARDRD